MEMREVPVDLPRDYSAGNHARWPSTRLREDEWLPGGTSAGRLQSGEPRTPAAVAAASSTTVRDEPSLSARDCHWQRRPDDRAGFALAVSRLRTARSSRSAGSPGTADMDERARALEQIVALARDHRLTAAEIAAALADRPKPEPEVVHGRSSCARSVILAARSCSPVSLRSSRCSGTR